MFLADSNFSSNYAYMVGGAIAISNDKGSSSMIQIARSFFYNNSASQEGAAIYITFTTDTVIDSCTFIDNRGTMWDSALFLHRCPSISMSYTSFKSILSHSNDQPYIAFVTDSTETVYRTYRTVLSSGNSSFNSANQSFWNKTRETGMVQIIEVLAATRWPVIHKETPFSSGKICF